MNSDQSGSSVDVEIKRVGKNTAIYSIGNIATKIVTFLLIPLYTNYLSVYEVGVIILLEVLELMHHYVAPMGTIRGLWRYYFVAKKHGEEKRLISSAFLTMQGANLCIFLLLILGSGLGAKVYLSDPDLASLLRTFALILFLGLSKLFFVAILRMQEKALLYITLALTEFISLISLTIWFVAGLDLGLWGVIYAKLIVVSLFFLAVLIFILKNYSLHIYTPDIKRTVSFGFPLIFYYISLLVLNMSDRVFLKALISVDAAGIYGICYKFGMILNMVLVTPFIQAWNPILFSLEQDASQKIIYKKIALHYVQIGVFVWLAVSVVSEYLITTFTTEDYFIGVVIVPWVAFAYLLYGLQEIFKAGTVLNNATLSLTKFGIACALLNLILNIALIPYMGILGAAIATVIAYFLLMLLVVRLSQHFLPIEWLWQKMMLVALIGWGVFFVSRIEVGEFWLKILKDAGILVLFPILLIVLKLVSIEEVRRTIRLFRGTSQNQREHTG